jgi:DNA-directed RNA polymerase specialized sigma24 family protein
MPIPSSPMTSAPRPAPAVLDGVVVSDCAPPPVSSALAGLDDQHRHALTLVCGHGLSYATAAETMGLERGAFVRLLLEARRSLVLHRAG